MALKLYGHPMSTCASRVLACLYEMDADFELVLVNLQARDNKQPSYLATKNPFGKIPALEDGDLTLFESRAINGYIVTKYKGTGPDLLRLDNLKESALIKVWMEVESHSFNPPISAVVYQILIIPLLGGTTDDQVVEANVEKLAMVLDVYEERLSKSKYLAGDFYSLADLHHIPYIHYFMKTPKASLISSRRHVKAWWDDISSRPATKKMMEGMSIGGNA
ncbi:glutathione S-transferase F13-like [Magnolia sinica]|uniref:glutathione S-transferase F13-like n=1 Tax=Magnolia sinica TaxID=86752 RepID=UPI002657D63C|nr:glutathione S-transferase F13-like [Magnolia sinica]